jgi:tRNA dimethylallyltransferase
VTGTKRPEVWCLLGPTGTGKTALALELARHHPLEVISVDSALVYRDMDIGTAKPTPAERAAVMHHLIDVVPPTEAYSAARFAADARAAISACLARGHTPLLVGGTGLYFRALSRGLSPLPPSDPAVRAELQARLDAAGSAVLHEELRAVDPVAASRIHPNDPQRILRALEVQRLTATPLSALQARAQGEGAGWFFRRVVLAPRDREAHGRALRRRFEAMLEAGLIDEVERLLRDYSLHADLPSMRCVGYRQVLAYLADHRDLAVLIDEATQATRQLAKRQLTWFRSEPGATWAAVDVDQQRRNASLQYLRSLFMLR